MSWLELPQQHQSLPLVHWVSKAAVGQQSRQQSSSLPRLWICTLTTRPATAASKPTTTSFSASGYTNTPEHTTGVEGEMDRSEEQGRWKERKKKMS